MKCQLVNLKTQLIIMLCLLGSCSKAPLPTAMDPGPQLRDWSEVLVPVWNNFSPTDTAFPGMAQPSMQIYQALKPYDPDYDVPVFAGYTWDEDRQGWHCATSPGFWPDLPALDPYDADGWWIRLSHPVTGQACGQFYQEQFTGTMWFAGLMDRSTGAIRWRDFSTSETKIFSSSVIVSVHLGQGACGVGMPTGPWPSPPTELTTGVPAFYYCPDLQLKQGGFEL